MFSLQSLFLAVLASAATADPVPISEVMSGMRDAEVSASGKLGTLMGDWSLRTADAGSFLVDLAVDRATLRAIENCEFSIFSEAKACRVNTKAEMKVDGGLIRLLVYEITVLGEPAIPPE